MTDQPNPAKRQGQTLPPPRARRLRPAADPRAAEACEDDPAREERTSPFPYAERFDEWVADETAPADDE